MARRLQAAHGVPNESLFGVSQVIVAGGFAYVAGQIARDGDGRPALTASFTAHVDRAVDNLDAMLARVGLERAAVVWVESHVVDEPESLASEHARWFDPTGTAGVILPIDGLYEPEYRVEITTIATTGAEMPRTSLPGRPGDPFARAVRVGDQVFVSAQHGLDSGTGSMDVGVQAGRAFDRVLECVTELGGTADDLVSTHIYVARELAPDELLALAECHRRRFTGENRPTSNLIGVRRLAEPGAVLEVCGVAVVSGLSGQPVGIP